MLKTYKILDIPKYLWDKRKKDDLYAYMDNTYYKYKDGNSFKRYMISTFKDRYVKWFNLEESRKRFRNFVEKDVEKTSKEILDLKRSIFLYNGEKILEMIPDLRFIYSIQSEGQSVVIEFFTKDFEREELIIPYTNVIGFNRFFIGENFDYDMRLFCSIKKEWYPSLLGVGIRKEKVLERYVEILKSLQ